jgi:hypothetical protein
MFFGGVCAATGNLEQAFAQVRAYRLLLHPASATFVYSVLYVRGMLWMRLHLACGGQGGDHCGTVPLDSVNAVKGLCTSVGCGTRV